MIGSLLDKRWKRAALAILALFTLMGLGFFIGRNTFPSQAEVAATSTSIASTPETDVPATSLTEEEPSPPNVTTSILHRVEENKYLKCGIHGDLKRFSKAISSSQIDDYYTDVDGFDADFCRVIAAAIFGNAYKEGESVRFYAYMLAKDRFQAVRNGEVDVLIRNSTHTPNREILGELRFGPVIFYDAQGFLLSHDDQDNPRTSLAGLTVCYEQGATHGANLSADLAKLEDDEKYVAVSIDDGDFVKDFLADGEFKYKDDKLCDAFSSDLSQFMVLSQVSLNVNGRILEKTISKEPLAPVYLANDPEWGYVVDTAIHATMYAAELEITQTDIVSYSIDSPNVDLNDHKVVSLLSITNTSSTENSRIFVPEYDFAPTLGLQSDFVRHIIKNVGNYEDIFDRHFNDVDFGTYQLNQVFKQENFNDVHRLCALQEKSSAGTIDTDNIEAAKSEILSSQHISRSIELLDQLDDFVQALEQSPGQLPASITVTDTLVLSQTLTTLNRDYIELCKSAIRLGLVYSPPFAYPNDDTYRDLTK